MRRRCPAELDGRRSTRGAITCATDSLVTKRHRPALRVDRTERVTARVDAAERRAAVGVPQALRHRRRGIETRPLAAALAERTVARLLAAVMALSACAGATLAAGSV